MRGTTHTLSHTQAEPARGRILGGLSRRSADPVTCRYGEGGRALVEIKLCRTIVNRHTQRIYRHARARLLSLPLAVQARLLSLLPLSIISQTE